MELQAMFYERDDADAVAARLRTDGFSADVARVRFAGEDDDEDHPWVVRTDAPEFMVELLVEQYDGWLDLEPPEEPPTVADPAARSGVPPLDLPEAPRRIKNHFPRD